MIVVPREFVLLVLLATTASSAVGQQATRPRTRAQQLVNETMARHRELSGLELALLSDVGCATVAATAPEDIGEKCDADEKGPIRTGHPDIEAPTRADPVYDITQALHDAAGKLIGAIGMDIPPLKGESRAAVLRRAQAILAEIEGQIPSKQALLRPAATSGGR